MNKKDKKQNRKSNHRYINLGYNSTPKWLNYTIANTPIKCMEWKLFRSWLKINLEPINHHNELTQNLQNKKFRYKMNKFLSFCSLIHIDGYDYYCLWLQKGINVSGTDALAIENAISSALDLRWVYLHDDTKIKYGGNSKRGDFRIYLKTIRTIAKGQSWYAQAYYKPFNCNN